MSRPVAVSGSGHTRDHEINPVDGVIQFARKYASKWVLSRTQPTLHATRPTRHGDSRFGASNVCLVGENPGVLRLGVVGRRRVYGQTTTAIHENECTPVTPLSFPAMNGYFTEPPQQLLVYICSGVGPGGLAVDFRGLSRGEHV